MEVTMKHTSKFLFPSSLLLIAALAISACAPLALPSALQSNMAQPAAQQPAVQQQIATPVAPAPLITNGSNPLTAYEDTLTAVYEKVNPSVVSIQVSSGTPDNPSGVQGSGFIWDLEGNIVTNNHVVEGANRIQVVMYDGAIYPATLVGADPDSDLAVVKIDSAQDTLRPVELGDSSSLRVGEVAIALGNPFGLANTMTVGIISAVGRTLSGSNANSSGPGFTNPDVIQTDAAINPGNSGGVLVDENGLLIGVPSAIESPIRANAGVGFAIPSQTVARVVPALIQNGAYAYSWLGISGTSLVPQIAQAMNLDAGQRGVMVAEVTSGGPAAKAGLRASDQTATIEGVAVQVGGDVITAIDGQTVKAMDDLIAYLNAKTRPGQQVTLTVLRGGSSTELAVELGTRPTTTSARSQNPAPQPQTNPSAFLGLSAVPLSAAINEKLNLPTDTQGLLIQKIEAGSPAEKAGLREGSRAALIDGRRIFLDGDVVTSIDGQALTSVQDLRSVLSQSQPGDEITLEILRDGKLLSLEASLTARPAQ
jgi:S1-C subfamily serine protease